MAAAGLALLVAGCSTGGGLYTPTTQPFPAGTKITGRAMGGQNPVDSGVVQLYAVGTGANKSAAMPLISSASTTRAGGTGTYPVVTNSSGYFSITGDYDCPSNAQVYLTITYGKTIPAASTTNSFLGLMAALGPCSALSSATYINVNEVTTVAGAYVLAPFMGADYAHVANPNATAVANAMTMANNLVDFSAGSVPGPSLPVNTTVSPAGLIDSLANAISSCINSDPNANATACNTLAGITQNSNGVAPTDTITAAANIASNPGNNIGTIFNQIPAVGAPFGNPQLTSAPQDWSLSLKYSDASLVAPYGVAIDASGNAWVTNEGGLSVTKIAANGAILSGSTGYKGGGTLIGPQGIAIDKTGTVWVANTATNSVVKLDGSTGALAGSYTSASNLVAPTAIAIDSANNAWVANLNSNTIVEISSGGVGTALAGGRSGGSFNQPSSIAVDGSGNIWTSNIGYGNVVKFSNAGVELSSTVTGYTDSNTIGPMAVAADTSGNSGTNGNIWLASSGTSALDGFNNGGVALAATSYAGGGINVPAAMAIDGSSAVWITNGRSAGSLSKLAVSSGTYSAANPSTGLGTLSTPIGVAVDASGNVWTVNSGDNSVSEFIGVAIPVVTPLVAKVGP
ncbi:MAG TPA: NHL repeat-containing protein [Acidobacteriaceae bacterium]